jgi:hypothetical protein
VSEPTNPEAAKAAREEMARLVERAHGGDGAAHEEMIRLIKRAQRGSEK